ncbi:DUF413 domain-containing protein [Pseudomaricurvus alkylphenolicus]|jgi:uncharacterized protein YifE (UPF0438 family)|uniref:DUF413 domain-containing protein n=1 Tax=Pseudomaricurvus alkylphenolicus TaxID=1306991 RepID=UPI0014243FE4|nr:DUF413 domain-containing protein [Pseudomaricurvus alkylphenolicus]NIB41887.1 DUF413 domain-containing protein [Pseudomaricurvus alkylphenolicus]
MSADNNSFDQQGRIYWGTEHFPYGLAKSGQFTRQQVELLERHGYAYEALASGERTPITPEEKSFLQFCQGEQEPDSAHEKAWDRYLREVSKTGIVVTSSASQADASSGYNDALDLDEL